MGGGGGASVPRVSSAPGGGVALPRCFPARAWPLPPGFRAVPVRAGRIPRGRRRARPRARPARPLQGAGPGPEPARAGRLPEVPAGSRPSRNSRRAGPGPPGPGREPVSPRAGAGRRAGPGAREGVPAPGRGRENSHICLLLPIFGPFRGFRPLRAAASGLEARRPFDSTDGRDAHLIHRHWGYIQSRNLGASASSCCSPLSGLGGRCLSFA